jgi:hypothetical protein
MLPYWLLFAFFAVASLFARERSDRDAPRSVLIIAWLILALMIGLRWEVGPDWAGYINSWEIAGYKSVDGYLRAVPADPVFYMLMYGFRQFGASFWLFNLVVAGIFATGLMAFARKQANPWLAIAIAVPYLVIVVAMSGVRQATAIGFVFLALLAFQRREGRKFLVWMALAASCHASAILVLPLAGLSFARNRFQSIVLMLIAALAAYYLLSPTFSIYSERYFSKVVQSSGTLFRIGMSIVPALIYLFFSKRFPEMPHERSLWRNFSIAALLTLPLYLIVPSSTALDRLVLYLFPLQIRVLSWVPSIARGAKGLMTFAILAYLAAQVFVFLSYAVNRDAYLPYRTIFSQPAR